MTWVATSALPCDHASPGHARKFCAEQLEAVPPPRPASEDTLADAVLIASELVTNAVRAGCGRIQLELSLDESGLHVAVYDDAPGVAVLHYPDPHEPHGRGLAITAQIAKRWGCNPSPIGKHVWAHIPATIA